MKEHTDTISNFIQISHVETQETDNALSYFINWTAEQHPLERTAYVSTSRLTLSYVLPCTALNADIGSHLMDMGMIKRRNNIPVI